MRASMASRPVGSRRLPTTAITDVQPGPNRLDLPAEFPPRSVGTWKSSRWLGQRFAVTVRRALAPEQLAGAAGMGRDLPWAQTAKRARRS
jgi:hypothetical protein